MQINQEIILPTNFNRFGLLVFAFDFCLRLVANYILLDAGLASRGLDYGWESIVWRRLLLLMLVHLVLVREGWCCERNSRLLWLGVLDYGLLGRLRLELVGDCARVLQSTICLRIIRAHIISVLSSSVCWLAIALILILRGIFSWMNTCPKTVHLGTIVRILFREIAFTGLKPSCWIALSKQIIVCTRGHIDIWVENFREELIPCRHLRWYIRSIVRAPAEVGFDFITIPIASILIERTKIRISRSRPGCKVIILLSPRILVISFTISPSQVLNMAFGFEGIGYSK